LYFVVGNRKLNTPTGHPRPNFFLLEDCLLSMTFKNSFLYLTHLKVRVTLSYSNVTSEGSKIEEAKLEFDG